MKPILMALAMTVIGIGGSPQRDAATVATADAASVAGVVVDDQQPPRPVRRAVVTLTGDTLRPNRGAISDDDGRFAIRNLPPGRFILSAERGGYITSAYGAKRPGRPGSAISVGAGQAIKGLQLRIWRGAAMAGIIRDAAGTPVPNATVEVLPAREVTVTGLTLSNRDQARTNDLGEFRVFGLMPGTYVVRASAGPTGTTELMTSDADIDAVFAALAARLNRPGPAGPSMTRIEVPASTVAGAAIYFPGTPTIADATPLTLGAGEVREGVDFAVRKIPTAAIRGTVTLPGGTPAASSAVILGSTVPAIGFAGLAPRPMTQNSTGTGQFALTPVSPGEYKLLIRGVVTTTDPSGSRFWWASQTLRVNGDDIDLGSIALQPGLTMSGRVNVDAASGQPGPDLAGLKVELRAGLLEIASGRSRGGGGPGPYALQPGLTRADGSFDVLDLVSDEYTLALTGLPADSPWWLRSAMWNGRDLLDGPFRIEPQQNLRGVTLVLSNRRTELSGTLTTPAGTAESDVFVIAFPVENALRLPRSRRVQAVRPDSTGRFVFANLPAGDYLVCALTDVDDGDWNEPGFFDPLVGASVRVTLADGEKKVQNLRVGGG